MENKITIALSQRDMENVSRLSFALTAYGKYNAVFIARYMEYLPEQLMQDIESLSRVIGAFFADQREDGDE